MNVFKLTNPSVIAFRKQIIEEGAKMNVTIDMGNAVRAGRISVEEHNALFRLYKDVRENPEDWKPKCGTCGQE